MKATFDLSLTVDKGDMVIANTEMVSDMPAADGMHTQTFATTPKMSTYLLAFQVGDWVCSKGEADGVPIRVVLDTGQDRADAVCDACRGAFPALLRQYFGDEVCDAEAGHDWRSLTLKRVPWRTGAALRIARRPAGG